MKMMSDVVAVNVDDGSPINSSASASSSKEFRERTLRSLKKGLGRLWRRHRGNASITEYDPSYKVAYLGNVLTGWAKVQMHTDLPRVFTDVALLGGRKNKESWDYKNVEVKNSRSPTDWYAVKGVAQGISCFLRAYLHGIPSRIYSRFRSSMPEQMLEGYRKLHSRYPSASRSAIAANAEARRSEAKERGSCGTVAFAVCHYNAEVPLIRPAVMVVERVNP